MRYVLRNFFLNHNLGCFSLIFVPLPAAWDSPENAFGDWVYWDSWVVYRKMEQPVNLVESVKSWDIDPPTSTRPDLADCTEAVVNNLDQLQYDTKLPLGYFYNFILNRRKSLKPSKHSLAGGETSCLASCPHPSHTGSWDHLVPLQLPGRMPSLSSISLSSQFPPPGPTLKMRALIT